MAELFIELEQNPNLGTALGNDIYIIRLAIASKKKGKYGGARILTFVKIVDSVVLVFSIYNKDDRDSISDNEIQELLKAFL